MPELDDAVENSAFSAVWREKPVKLGSRMGAMFAENDQKAVDEVELAPPKTKNDHE